MTLDVYNLNQLEDCDDFPPQKLEALSNGNAKLVEVKFPLGNTIETILHVIHDNAHRRVPALKPAFSEKEGSSTLFPEAWFRSKAVWAIPPTVHSNSDDEEEDEEEEEASDEEEGSNGEEEDDTDDEEVEVDVESDVASDDDESSESGEESEEEDSDDSNSESDANTTVDSDSDSDNDEAVETKPTATSVERSRDEVDAVLGYMLGACGLECDQRSYERLVGVKYSWRDLEKIVNICQSSESWPFESSVVNSPNIVEVP
ncbi:hypothetical protein SCHPADRAFT_607059 [Schizopora paradoxa]|uniref:Uncharacterized protein n=1 Tax=Schizopora paradoxa TaxID=27342 RepID=A0A0H2R9I4_9AGAM|nr:hypothetical protein SCHPADRAFT_607059 [Schizopora paradoxa]